MFKNFVLMLRRVVNDLFTFFFGITSGLKNGSEYDFCITGCFGSTSLGNWYLYSFTTFSSFGSYLYNTEYVRLTFLGTLGVFAVLSLLHLLTLLRP